MKAAVYAVDCDGRWKVWITLDMRVDSLWWSGTGQEHEGWNSGAADKLVLLSPSLPLGWAVKLRESFQSIQTMQEWKEEDWAQYIAEVLSIELREEREKGGQWDKGWIYEGISICPPFREGSFQFSQSSRGEARPEWIAEDRASDLVRGHSELEHGWKESEATKQTVSMKVESAREHTNLHSKAMVQADYAEEGIGQLTLGAEADQLGKALAGRSLLQPEAEALLAEVLPELAGYWRAAAQLAHLQGRLRLEAAVRAPALRRAGPGWAARLLQAAALRLPRRGAATARRAQMRCLRCGSAATGRTACAACGLAGCAYCEACLALGRSRACALLLRSAASPAVQCTAGASPTVAARRWGLSAAQAGAAGAALGFLAEPRQRSAAKSPERFLLWAVTGAGKTEITFPLLDAVLAAGGRALVATPRRDVVLELAPRLARAFPAETLAVLYGGSADRWSDGRITLATTHQLLRFHQSFDLVILDEVDAFPFHNDSMLAYAAEHASKPRGSFIYLSATPPKELQHLARSGKLPHARVPVRFHGHPLPVPRHLEMAPVQQCLKRGFLPRALLEALRRSFTRQAQIFLFVSRIAHIEGILTLLRRNFPGTAIEGTSSQDPARAEKVAAFRSRIVSLLVTTTILERGVTVPRSDVFILDADSGLFDEAALVQMAGRAGRSKDDPAGTVVFASPQWTRSQRGAISQIRTMNTIARRQGYLSISKPHRRK
ncbi:helicase-related protein [Paenibacillus sp. HW567]|uniref:helicase-related protein n=1 Tax=Paenibacillus sp. HW567 TaxID=1034769 RepID=UPI000379807E|nr:helicase-related protein [Paenibacillus sp. HW567]